MPPLTDRAQYCISIVMDLEGGYVNNPNDPGGETKYGISKASYPSIDIANLTPEQATFYYQRDYWLKIQADKMPQPLDLYVLDGAVNHGIARATLLLQQACNVATDGVIGPQTLQACFGLNAKDYLVHRAMFYAACREWPVFGHGWMMRLFKLCVR